LIYSGIKDISEVMKMARSRQLGLRLDENDDMNLKRIAELEGRTEQDILRDSLRMYVRNADEQREFIDSVERGWYELRSGLGEVVAEDDDFFSSIRNVIRNEKTPD
jgi:predicted transcriptional regulator